MQVSAGLRAGRHAGRHNTSVHSQQPAVDRLTEAAAEIELSRLLTPVERMADRQTDRLCGDSRQGNND